MGAIADCGMKNDDNNPKSEIGRRSPQFPSPDSFPEELLHIFRVFRVFRGDFFNYHKTTIRAASSIVVR
jgi:hypothetical protein